MKPDLAVALTSGLLAGVSGCAIPVYPAMFSQMTMNKENPRLAALFFTMGLTGVYFLIYLVLGTLMSFLGLGFLEKAETFRGYLTIFAALFSWLMAWRMLNGGIRGSTVKLINAKTGSGYLGALASGVVYGSIITPCNAPFVVAGILQALASKGGVFGGVLLLTVFSAAMGAPMLLLGWASGTALSTFDLLRRNSRRIELASAFFLALTGFYFLYLFLLTVGVGL